ncbi:MAG: trimethylamine methyltransferase family protein [Anaerolineales bacterium]|jgi:trimethylamine--corrinoid protein Co-methyltransferase|uniref:trimethylamine methyltransferase family protein n=1 Tax=Candidatus Villigracilis vicinus TaxID=3140679 RepID=UPI003134A8BA|nr:trimethylamine methyltransferase family protein [Anaerolineales bacterium]MBK7448535.1 trimethylamine methyltransferase family protein [Anaerolineales bacterium]MBK9782540.1 trimethylamine methyltransferase family protein [Anaerolineales bacterium]
MRPKLTLLSDEIIARILAEAYELLLKPGIKVQNEEARELLMQEGVVINPETHVAQIPASLVQRALESVPREFYLYDYHGNPVVHYGGDSVHFDPGSSGITMLNPDTLEHETTETEHLIRLLKVAEQIPQYDAQSTAVICHDVSKDIQDSYRLYLTLLYSKKPIVTGAFTNKTVQEMIDMLEMFAGSPEEAREKPRAIFDVCPAPPLIWSNFGAGNLIRLARAGIPAEIVSVPLSGAAAPVTMLGTVTQHAAECLAGITIHQLAKPGSPIVWGGAAAIFDMRKGATPMGAVETAMLDCSYAQVAKTLGMPTHTYLGATDSKLVDAQAGLESGITAMVGALSGINMISGSGMLDFLACHSAEKLVIDAEGIAMAKRLIGGVKQHTDTLATGFYDDKINFKGGDFLKQKITMQLFREEQHLPGNVIDRSSTRAWKEAGSLDAFGRAKLHVKELLASYTRPDLDPAKVTRLHAFMLDLAKKAGHEELPKLEEYQLT